MERQSLVRTGRRLDTDAKEVGLKYIRAPALKNDRILPFSIEFSNFFAVAYLTKAAFEVKPDTGLIRGGHRGKEGPYAIVPKM